MNHQERQELIDLVQQDCKQVIQFLNGYNLKVKDNKVEMVFSDGEVDRSTIDQQTFVNLWELQYEPSLVKAEFTLESSNESSKDLKVILGKLIDKITIRGWHD